VDEISYEIAQWNDYFRCVWTGQIDREKKMEYDLHTRLMYAMRTTKANQVFEDILSICLSIHCCQMLVWIKFGFFSHIEVYPFIAFAIAFRKSFGLWGPRFKSNCCLCLVVNR
jgi:hypothetical protein